MFPHRRPPRLEMVFCDPTLYFVTICVRRRLALLATNQVHLAFQEFAWTGYKVKQIAIGRYVIMPDHLHLFVQGPQEFRLEQWGRMLKLMVGRAAKRTANWRNLSEFWERGLFDHVIRNSESYSEKWEYVRQNPVRAGLVERAEDWPYQGEIVRLPFD